MEEGAEVGCGRWDGVDEGGAGVRFGGIILGGGWKDVEWWWVGYGEC